MSARITVFHLKPSESPFEHLALFCLNFVLLKVSVNSVSKGYDEVSANMSAETGYSTVYTIAGVIYTCNVIKEGVKKVLEILG